MHGKFWQIITSVPTGYDLIVIEEEKIPLVASVTKDYELWLAVTGGLIAFLLFWVAVIVYAAACDWKRGRVAELEQLNGQIGYKGWNILRLRREINRLEMEVIEKI